MPLDDTNWAAIVLEGLPGDARVSSVPVREHYPAHRALFTRFEHAILIAMGILLLGTLGIASEEIVPDAGLITRITYGNAIAGRNFLARAILANGQRLTFTVAGIRYEVISPRRALTPAEQQAVLGYAEWKGLPPYSADGPLAIDP